MCAMTMGQAPGCVVIWLLIQAASAFGSCSEEMAMICPPSAVTYTRREGRYRARRPNRSRNRW